MNSISIQNPSCFLAPKSITEPSQSKFGFNNTIHFKTQSNTTRFRPIKATAVNNFYVSTENFYDLLGISESGSLSEIKKAYKQLARKYHPDVSPPEFKEEYTQKFIRVQEAYETLSDPNSRALYDRNISSGLHLAFSTRNQFHYHQEMYEKSEWQQRWQQQLEELMMGRNRSEDRRKMSWGARMRQHVAAAARK